MLLRHFSMAALVVAGLSAALLFNEFHAYSSDAGQHYALVRALMDLDHLGRPAITPNLGGLPFYPPLSHWLAAEVGKVLGSGWLGMTLVASVSVGLFYLAMFAMSLQINRRASLFACLGTIFFALVRGPVIGRLVVNNYFYAQVVGTCIAVLTLFIALNKFHKWKGPLVDLFVLIMGQAIVATHLMPAEQLIGAYGMVLLVHAWTTASWLVFGRLIVFSATTLVLTALSPYAWNVYEIAQSEGGAHVNLLLQERPVQILVIILGGIASVRLILKTRKEAGAGMFLGCIGLSSCGLVFLQMVLFWIGTGSNYAIVKQMFFNVACFIFVVSADISLKKPSPDLGWSDLKNLAWCSILALITMRVDLYPSILNLNKVTTFEAAARDLSARVKAEGGGQTIVLAKQWPPNISYGINIGDLHLPMTTGDLVLFNKPVPENQISIVFMPPDDPGVIPECVVPAYSNHDAEAFDYACVTAKH